MTLVSSIITDAYRETNIVALAGGQSTAQTTEALNRLNPLILSTVGNEAGDDLKELSIGGEFDDTMFTTQWVPDNVRLMLNLSAARTLSLDPYPRNGQRVAIVDIGSNLGTYNLTLDPNGRLIEGASTLVLATDDLVRQWMYRSDTGNWARIATLTTADQMPFPSEFDDYFVTMLAMRLSPRYGQEMPTESLRALSRSRNLLRARFNQLTEVPPDLPPLQMDRGTSFRFNDDFSTGRIGRR
jgi:hypothetical protein